MYKIYGIDNCPYCEMARDLMPDAEYIDVTNDQTLRTSLRAIHGTVPVVYKGDELIGGYTEFAASLRESEEHNTLQKITWWWVTIVCWVFDRKEYDVRMQARQNCIDRCSL